MKTSILFTTRTSAQAVSTRIQSVDSIRGAAMVLMTAAHIPTHSDSLVLMQQWLIQGVAPVFVFLAGTSAWLIQGRRPIRSTALFLLKRGCLLAILQLIPLPFVHYPVLAAMGCSMILLAGLLYLPYVMVMAIGLVIIGSRHFLPDIPLLSWPGFMALGFCFGRFYTSSRTRRLRQWPVPRNPLIIFGRTPLFYFFLHLFVIYSLSRLIPSITTLPAVVFISLLVLLITYPLCHWYGRYKQRYSHQWWSSYL